MNLCSLASSSSGNCIYVGNTNTHLLVDVGISAKRINEALEEIDLKISDVNGILITHEHSDHIKGLGVIARKQGIPIYATENTIQAIKSIPSLGKIEDSLYHVIRPNNSFSIQDIQIEPNSTWHDAADSVCYSFESDKHKISIATDLGNYDDYLLMKLKDSDVLFIEANHDINMLQVGPYPYYLKQRILSNHGHLSNERSGQFIHALLNNHIKGIMLGHLSKENNLTELAYETVNVELQNNVFTKDVRDFNLQVANRDTRSPILSAN